MDLIDEIIIDKSNSFEQYDQILLVDILQIFALDVIKSLSDGVQLFRSYIMLNIGFKSDEFAWVL